MPGPYTKTTHGGKVVDEITHQALLAVEKRLGYSPGSLTILQGSYNAGGVSASAGTHDGGGAVDLSANDWKRKVRALRAVGFAAWYRPALPGVWGPHIHAVLIGNQMLSPAARAQVADYYAHKDGLADHATDNSWRPHPIPVFKWPPPKPSATFTVGEHNLHDEAGRPTPFADVVFFCEAIPPTIRERIGLWVQRSQAAACKDQRDLVLVLPRDFKITEKLYFLAHKGIAKVTPHRGTFVVKTKHKPTGRKVAFVLGHRINSWFKPERGEQRLRSTYWHKHQDLDIRIIDGLKREGYAVIAGGDMNCPPDVLAYDGHLTEVSTSLDRIAASRDVALSEFERLAVAGSDHHRIKATARL